MVNNDAFENDIDALNNEYPDLKIVDFNDLRFLRGSLEIRDVENKLCTTFNIEIKASSNYPYSFPKVFEIGNTFPKIADWHINNDNSFCFDVPESEKLICFDGLNLVDFTPKILIPYLANQHFRKINGYYLYGEYSHGILGRIEYYQDLLKPKSNNELILMMKSIAVGLKFNRQAMCPFCNKKMRHCQRRSFNLLLKIKEYVEIDCFLFFKYFLQRNEIVF